MCSESQRIEIANRWHKLHAVGNVDTVRCDCGAGSRVRGKEHRNAEVLCGNSQHIERSAQSCGLTHVGAMESGVRESTRTQRATDMQCGSIKGSRAACCWREPRHEVGHQVADDHVPIREPFHAQRLHRSIARAESQ